MAAAAKVYGWPECYPKEQTWLSLSAGDQARVTGVFILVHDGETYETNISAQDQGLIISCPIMSFPNPFYCIEQSEGNYVFMNSSGVRVQFSVNDNKQTLVTILGNVFVQQENLTQ